MGVLCETNHGPKTLVFDLPRFFTNFRPRSMKNKKLVRPIETRQAFDKLKSDRKSLLNRIVTKRNSFGKQEYGIQHAEAMCLLHRCFYLSRPQTINKIEDIPDFRNKRTLEKEFIKKYFRMIPPGSEAAWKCYECGCADGTYVPKQLSAEQKKQYLGGTFYPPYEKDINALNAQREEMLRRAGIPTTNSPQ